VRRDAVERLGERIEMPIFPIPAIFGDFPSLESHEYNSNQFVSRSETIFIEHLISQPYG